MGPLINETSYNAFKRYVGELSEKGHIRTGGKPLDLGKGYYVAPTIVEDLPDDHYLWKHEMFAPILLVGEFDDKDTAMKKANEQGKNLDGEDLLKAFAEANKKTKHSKMP